MKNNIALSACPTLAELIKQVERGLTNRVMLTAKRARLIAAEVGKLQAENEELKKQIHEIIVVNNRHMGKFLESEAEHEKDSTN